MARAMAVADDDAAQAGGRAEFWESRFRLASAVIGRAVAGGGVGEHTAPRLALELLIAPPHFRVLLTREPMGEHLADQLAEVLAHGG